MLNSALSSLALALSRKSSSTSSSSRCASVEPSSSSLSRCASAEPDYSQGLAKRAQWMRKNNNPEGDEWNFYVTQICGSSSSTKHLNHLQSVSWMTWLPVFANPVF
jgi:hypothetical protein